MSINTLNDYSLTKDNSIKLIKNTIASNQKYYSQFRINCIAVKSDDKWHNAICSITTFPVKEMPAKRQSMIYPNVKLIEDWIEPLDFIEWIEGLDSGNLNILGTPVVWPVNTNFSSRRFLTKNNPYSKFSGNLFSTHQGGQQNYYNEKLISHDQPYYPNIFKAIPDWVGISDFNGDRDSRLKTIQLFLPELQAHIKEVSYAEEQKTIQIDVVNQNKSRELYISGGYQTITGYKQINTIVKTPVIEIKADPVDINDIRDYEIYLLDKANNIVDYYTGKIETTNTPDTPIEDDIKRYMTYGEGEQIEYKPYIKAHDKKINELIETVIAFLNTEGGYIFIGVNDNIIIEGVEDGISNDPHIKDPTLEKKLGHYCGYLYKEISDRLDKHAPLDITPIGYGDHSIIVIDIPKGSNKPYYNIQTREIYIRRGANNFRPNPDTELPKLYE